MAKGPEVSREYPPLFERKKVITDEVLESGLSGHVGRLIPIHGIRVLTLEDDSVVHGCRDCEFTGTRGEVKGHRAAEHGIALGGGVPKRSTDPAVAGQLPYPSAEVLSMTFYELMELAQHVGEWEIVLGNQTTEIEELRGKLAEEIRLKRRAERELDTLKRRVKRLLGEE
jgi:hypothetical protein